MVRRGGPGAKCLLRSSAAHSESTDLLSCCPYHVTSTVVALGTFVGCSQLIDLACVGVRLFSAVAWVFYRCSMLGVRCRVGVQRIALVGLIVLGAISSFMLFAAGVRYLYGGEANEVIRFMEPASTSATDREHELLVLQLIEGVTGASYFGTEGHRTAQFGVNLYVRPGPEAERQRIRVACAADKPTQLDAARQDSRQRRCRGSRAPCGTRPIG